MSTWIYDLKYRKSVLFLLFYSQKRCIKFRKKFRKKQWIKKLIFRNYFKLKSSLKREKLTNAEESWKLFVLISEGNRLCGNVALFAMFGCWREDSNSTRKRKPNSRNKKERAFRGLQRKLFETRKLENGNWKEADWAQIWILTLRSQTTRGVTILTLQASAGSQAHKEWCRGLDKATEATLPRNIP